MVDLGMAFVDTWVVGKEKVCYWLRVKIIARDFEGLVKVETVFEGKEPLVEDVKCRGFAEEEND